MVYDEIKAAILNSQKEFKQLLQKIEQVVDNEEKQRLAYKAITYANVGSTGYYSSDIIEKVFIDIGQAHTLDVLPDYQANTVLHVMTQSYEVGGHTRVVERWIELSESNQKQSLLFTAAESHQIPERLEKAVKDKMGKIIKLPDRLSDIEKGLKLREIAASYQFIVLHIHPHDVVPLIAFGNKQFKRPVLFFNHADHRFWLGVSIVDLVINLRSWGEKLSFSRRGIKNSTILAIPIDSKQISVSKDIKTLRQTLSLPLNSKVIVTVGAPHKYKPVIQFNFLKIVKKILKRNNNVIVIFIGPDSSTLSGWKQISKLFDSRVFALGYKPPQKMFEYLMAGDLVLDSFPMSGGTALIDAVTCGKPVLSLECPTGQLDYIVNTVAYCLNEQILLDKVDSLLHSEQFIQENIQDVLQNLKEDNSVENWQDKLKKIYQTMEKTIHKITPFNPIVNDQITDIDIYIFSEVGNIHRKWFIPFIFSYCKVRIGHQRYKTFTFFNKFRFKMS